MQILDTGAEDVFDRLTRLAAAITGRPIALVSLVDQHRQWWKSAVGPLPQGGQTPREISFCIHAIAQDELFEVPDARLDERFSDSPLVTGSPWVVHYAGMPLKMPGGQRVGTLCVMDQQPGPLPPASADVLRELGGLVVDVLAMRERDLAAAAAIEAERAHIETEKRLRTMSDVVPQMIWSATPDGRGDYYNARWYEFTGAARGSVDGDAWHAFVHPEDRQQVFEHWRDSVATGQAYELECRLRHASGQYRWIMSQAMPMREKDGTIVRWMGTCTDVHDRHLAEEMLSSADRRKDEFMATLSHELRNPLSPIASAAQLLMQSQDLRFQKVGDVIARQAAHIKALVDDLMDVTRIKQGLIELHRETLDLREVVNDAVEQVWPLIQLKEQQIIVRPGDRPFFTWGDKVRLIQVVVNLVTNAAKYTPSRGLIEVTLEAETDTVRVIIRDNGQGIDERVLPHVFKLFTQEKRAHDRSSGGLGVGLALVRKLCELHGGTVAVQSEGKGQGSTFAVSLPRLDSVAVDS